MLRRIWAITQKELIQVLRDRATLLLLLLMPIMQLALFATAIHTDIKHIPMVVADQSVSTESRAYLNALVQSDYFDIVATTTGPDGITDAIDEGQARLHARHLDDKVGGVNAQRVYEAAAESHLAPIEYRVFPRHRLMPREGPASEPAGPLQGRVPEREVRSGSSGPAPEPPQIPPLLKGYLRVGAWVGGEPAWDPDFNTADLFVLLPLSRLGARYARHYCGAP